MVVVDSGINYHIHAISMLKRSMKQLVRVRASNIFNVKGMLYCSSSGGTNSQGPKIVDYVG